jgi:hypothetical protein
MVEDPKGGVVPSSAQQSLSEPSTPFTTSVHASGSQTASGAAPSTHWQEQRPDHARHLCSMVPAFMGEPWYQKDLKTVLCRCAR